MPIYFDLEFFVPLGDRTHPGFKFNPHKEAHFVLGGVFSNNNLYSRPKKTKYSHYWVWDEPYFDPYDPEEYEIGVLEKIYEHFKEEQRRIEKMSKNTLLYCVGTGITKIDLPVLYIRSMKHGIADADELFDLYFTGSPIDLTNVGVGFMGKQQGATLQPVRTSELMQKYKIKEDKEAGTKVWEYFDQGNYQQIANRTQKEVTINIDLYHRMRKKITKTKKK